VGEAEALTRKAIDLGLGGDDFALRLCLERILSPIRERTVQFELPPMKNLADAPKAISALLAGVANGELTPGEAGQLSQLIDKFTRAVQAKSADERENLEHGRSTRPFNVQLAPGLEQL
jgi:hypothetical protein